MSILFDSHEDPSVNSQLKKFRNRNQDERYPMQSGSIKKYDDLLIFGYHCKLFRDDQITEDLNKGKFLIPWMGNKDLMIDRYDCRGHLYKLEEFDFQNLDDCKPLTPEELDIENVCDEERYMDLKKDMSNELILLEEEEKRGSALYDPFTAYQNIEYSYEDSSAGKSMSECNINSSFNDESYAQFCQYYGYDPNNANWKAYFQSQSFYQYDYDRPPPPPDPPASSNYSVETNTETKTTYEKFVPPSGLKIPDGVEVPETRKMQSIIEKTAMFISKHSAQMEIVLKTKQSGNPQFAFLDFDNYLNPYYKFILGRIKEGEYVSDTENCTDTKEESGKNDSKSKDLDPPIASERKSSSDEEDDDYDENELHPLLQAHRRPIIQKLSPQPVETSEIEESIVNQVPQTKMTGKVEDLAKVYMTWKYTSNPETQNDNVEVVEDEGDENQTSMEGVDELPPPPPPPSASFFLSNLDDDNSEIHSPPPSGDDPSPTTTQNSSEPQVDVVEQAGICTTLSQSIPNYSSSTENAHSFEKTTSIPNTRFSSQIIGQQPYQTQIGLAFFNHVPGHFPSGHFQHAPPQMPYPHPNLYQVRSIPPPPPPPLPSLMPPGVDIPIISTIIPVTTQVTNTTTYESASTVATTSYVSQSSSITSAHISPSDNQRNIDYNTHSNSTIHDPLLPPGVEKDPIEKAMVPPPPPPPLPPSINVFKVESSKRKFEQSSSPLEMKDNIDDDIKNHGKQNGKDELHCSTLKEIADDEYATKDVCKYVKKEFNSDARSQFSSAHKNISQQSSDSLQYLDLENKSEYIQYDSETNKLLSDKNVDCKGMTEEVDISSPKPEVESKMSNYKHLHSSNFHVSPFDQINQTLKSLQHFDGSSSSQDDALSHSVTLPTEILMPGKDLQLVIDRLALYVAKNGEEFEVGIKDKKDPRFDFLNPWNMYHPYYLDKKKVNLEKVEIEKRKEEERKRNLKVKFGLKAKVKPVSVAKEKSATMTAAVFNQNDEEEISESPAEGFQPNKDPELEVKRRLQKQIEEKEKLLKQLQEQALLQQKIAEVNRQASAKPAQNLTPQQQALLKRKVQANLLKKDNNTATTKLANERKKRAASFVDMVNKKKADSDNSISEIAANFLRKRHFKETSGNASADSQPTDKVNLDKKKDAFFKAINDAFKGN